MSDETKSGSEDSGKDENSKTVDSLLEDWDTRKASKTEAKSDDSVPSIGDVEYLADKAIKAVKGDLDIPDLFVRRLLIGLSDEDPEFAKAWQEQNVNRKQWAEKLDAVAKEFQETMKPKEEAVEKDDANELAAAIRTARETKSSGHSLDDVNWATMPTHEFEAKKREVFALAKAGKL